MSSSCRCSSGVVPELRNRRGRPPSSSVVIPPYATPVKCAGAVNDLPEHFVEVEARADAQDGPG